MSSRDAAATGGVLVGPRQPIELADIINAHAPWVYRPLTLSKDHESVVEKAAAEIIFMKKGAPFLKRGTYSIRFY